MRPRDLALPTRDAAGTAAIEASLPAEPRPGRCSLPSEAEQAARVDVLREALAAAADTRLARQRLRGLLRRAEEVLAIVRARRSDVGHAQQDFQRVRLDAVADAVLRRDRVGLQRAIQQIHDGQRTPVAWPLSSSVDEVRS